MPAGGVFSYDESVAESAHGDLAGVLSGLQSSLDDLGGFVSKVKGSWDGDEMQEYGAVQAKWDAASATVHQILTSVHQALGTTTGSVRDMRGQVRTALRSS